MGEYILRTYQPGDEDAILSLHNQSFAGHEERSRRHWEWKFLENPLKRTEITLALNHGNKCLGVYTGVTHRFILEGEPCFAGNHIDVATDGNLRKGMAAARMLLRLGQLYFIEYAGGETKLTWGFPEPALARLGARLAKFEMFRDVVFLLKAPESMTGMPEEIEVKIVKAFDEDVDRLWQQCAEEIRTGLVRDRAYLNWRYADHPDHPHYLLEARDRKTGSLRGVTVLRQGGWDESIVSMMDWLVPQDDRAAETALVQRSLHQTMLFDKKYLACWFPVPSLQFNRFQLDHSFFAHATPYQEYFRPFQKGLARRWLDRHWYQTIGDIDFF
ncbi:MAG: hypothetical protein ACYTG7_18085 [Planctomycetota bacterium]|jgi:hypothetical protein